MIAPMGFSLLQSPGGRQLGDETELWRYTNLSTFLLLLRGHCFMPSVDTLQSGDRFEGQLGAPTIHLMGAIDENDNSLHDWLWKLAKEEGLRLPPDDHSEVLNEALIDRLYLRELAKRRAVWCWYEAPRESAAMWSLYGANGLAIRTSVGSLRAALPEEAEFMISRMRYHSRGFYHDFFEPERDPDLILRPHFLKSDEYASENEVRLVTRCSVHKKGEFVAVDSRKLVSEVRLSPLIHRREAQAIRQLILESNRLANGVQIEHSTLAFHQPDAESLTMETLDELTDEFHRLDEDELPPLMRRL